MECDAVKEPARYKLLIAIKITLRVRKVCKNVRKKLIRKLVGCRSLENILIKTSINLW